MTDSIQIYFSKLVIMIIWTLTTLFSGNSRKDNWRTKRRGKCSYKKVSSYRMILVTCQLEHPGFPLWCKGKVSMKGIVTFLVKLVQGLSVWLTYVTFQVLFCCLLRFTRVFACGLKFLNDCNDMISFCFLSNIMLLYFTSLLKQTKEESSWTEAEIAGEDETENDSTRRHEGHGNWHGNVFPRKYQEQTGTAKLGNKMSVHL